MSTLSIAAGREIRLASAASVTSRFDGSTSTVRNV